MIQFTADDAATAEAQVQALAKRCPATEQEPGCLQFEAFRSVLRPNTWALVEHWASEADLEQHRQRGGARTAGNVSRTREIYAHQES